MHKLDQTRRNARFAGKTEFAHPRVYRQPDPAYLDRNVALIASVFLCRVVAGDFRPGHETTDVAYFDPAELPKEVVPEHVRRIADALAVRDEA